MLIPSIRTDREPILDPKPWAAAQWQEWQKEAASFDAIAAYTWSFNVLVDDEGSELLEGMLVTLGVVTIAQTALTLALLVSAGLLIRTMNNPVERAHVGAGVLFAVVALLACWVPTRRAASIDPLEALRYE